MIQIFNLVKAVFNLLLVLVIGLVIVLGVLGSGWGQKHTPINHPLYEEDLMMIAHRGVADKVPENSLAAIGRAKELGFKSVEIDLKESGDQQFYLFHDRYGDRLFNRSEKISGQSLQEIQQWALHHQGVPTNFFAPSFDEVAGYYKNDFVFYLDIKRHGNDRFKHLADKVYNNLKNNNLMNKAFVGGDFLFIAYLEKRYPEIHTVFSGPEDSTIFVYKWIPKEFRPDFIISYANEVTPKHIAWLKKKELLSRRIIYGINEANFQKALDTGIPKLMVDYHPVMDPYLDMSSP